MNIGSCVSQAARCHNLGPVTYKNRLRDVLTVPPFSSYTLVFYRLTRCAARNVSEISIEVAVTTLFYITPENVPTAGRPTAALVPRTCTRPPKTVSVSKSTAIAEEF